MCRRARMRDSRTSRFCIAAFMCPAEDKASAAEMMEKAAVPARSPGERQSPAKTTLPPISPSLANKSDCAASTSPASSKSAGASPRCSADEPVSTATVGPHHGHGLPPNVPVISLGYSRPPRGVPGRELTALHPILPLVQLSSRGGAPPPAIGLPSALLPPAYHQHHPFLNSAYMGTSGTFAVFPSRFKRRPGFYNPEIAEDGPPPYTIGEVFWFEDPDAAIATMSPAQKCVFEKRAERYCHFLEVQAGYQKMVKRYQREKSSGSWQAFTYGRPPKQAATTKKTSGSMARNKGASADPTPPRP
ncbi:protein lyl-1 isoform X2 [Pleurodeles waltl]|uniref:protein lyl-1 isoform X2 n=1 Tax=Pleurodeles waltl TaxID=8319 RepID=UPI0037097BC1